MARTSGEAAIRDAVVNAEDVTEAADAVVAGGGRKSRDLQLAKKLMNDTGNSERLRSRSGRNLMFVPELGRFFYTGAAWSNKVGDKEWALAAQRAAARMMWEEGAALAEELGGEDNKRLNDFRNWAIDSGNSGRLSAMQKLSEPHLEFRVEQLDVNPFLFNVQNGTLELGNAKDRAEVRLRKHSRTDRITRIAPIGHDPSAECPKFRAFLDRILPDREVQDFLQRWFGYCLTADYSEHKLAVFWGEGSNGKGVLTKLIQWLLGDYGAVVQFQSFIDAGQRRGGEPSPDLAKLTGTRGVFASEAKKGARLDDGLIKQLSGGDPASVRKLQKDFFDLLPTFKINLICNNKPEIRDDTFGMWRRVVLIAFTVIIPEKDVDPNLLEKLKAEGPGILNWCLDGFRRWRDIGLVAPQAILAATATYRSESDRIGQFLEAATVRKPGSDLPASELYGCYEAWCRAMEHKPVSQTKFGEQVTKRGIDRVKRGVFYRTGIDWNYGSIDWDWQVPYPE